MKSLIYYTFLIFITVNSIDASLKIWKYNNYVLDPVNWENEKSSINCKGLIFPKLITSVATIQDLTIQEVILPQTGEIEIKGSLTLSDNDAIPCIKVKSIQFHEWLNPNSWHNNNSAIPDEEKIPCDYDDVIFPDNKTVSVYYPRISITVKSLQIQGRKLSQREWQNFIDSDYGNDQFVDISDGSEIHIRNEECNVKSGCVCHEEMDVNYWVCSSTNEGKNDFCMDPLKPIGNCKEICGGLIYVIPTSQFSLEDFEKVIPEYENVDFYVSKVKNNNQEVIQVVFADRNDYQEKSTDAAKQFYETLIDDYKKFHIDRLVTIKTSGPIGKRSDIFAITIGTFVAVCGFFIFIYAFYMGPLEKYNSRFFRYSFTGFSLGNWRPVIFARFDNREEGQISMAGSVISLEKSFDNPMFGKSTNKATSSRSGNVVILQESRGKKSESSHENPLYEATSCALHVQEEAQEDMEESLSSEE